MPRWLDRVVPHISVEGETFFEDLDRKRAEEAEEARRRIHA
jgi:hypothetical protein